MITALLIVPTMANPAWVHGYYIRDSNYEFAIVHSSFYNGDTFYQRNFGTQEHCQWFMNRTGLTKDQIWGADPACWGRIMDNVIIHNHPSQYLGIMSDDDYNATVWMYDGHAISYFIIVNQTGMMSYDLVSYAPAQARQNPTWTPWTALTPVPAQTHFQLYNFYPVADTFWEMYRPPC